MKNLNAQKCIPTYNLCLEKPTLMMIKFKQNVDFLSQKHIGKFYLKK